ncbi:hypothetical protein [Actinotalea subterranea]|uniref:hypothetical protein n=1 Tax=Actinotalea subterranea TaxID=2607497 RepID=UPI0011EFF878|nr:hypothetical protein [Actinotalea subterranea]
MRSSLGGRRPTVLVALGLAVGSLAGCAFGGGARAAAEDDRVPVPDEVLFDAVSEIAGVVRADLSYEDDVTDGSTYFGDIEVDADADPACVLDRAYALLWQGRDASVSVSVIQDGAYTQEDAIGVEGNQFMGEMEERYGRRPKDGVFVEPETPPACR